MPKAINNETRGAAQKKFKPVPELNGGLCIGALVDVSITDAIIKPDSPMESFRNMTVPRLNFVFESRLDPPGVKPAIYVHSYLPIEHTPSSVSTTDGGDWQWRSMSSGIFHMREVLVDGAALTPEQEAELAVDFPDVDASGMYLPCDSEAVVAAYRKFFEGVVKLFKPGDKAIYKDINGKDIILWIKLLLDINGKKMNNGDYGFALFPGEGYIEKFKQNIKPSLSINIAKGENIVPVATLKAPTAVGKVAGGTTVKQDDVPDFLK